MREAPPRKQQPLLRLPSGRSNKKVKTTVEMVSLRNQPVVSDATLIKRVPINYEFTITEAGGEAKIGANDKWIKVKDATMKDTLRRGLSRAKLRTGHGRKKRITQN